MSAGRRKPKPRVNEHRKGAICPGSDRAIWHGTDSSYALGFKKMDWITESVAIGNYLDAQDIELHRSEGVRSLLCLDGKLRGVAPQSIGLDALEVFDMKDGPGNDGNIFRCAVDAVSQLARKHPKLLVQCHAGRSRSVIVVAAYLMRSQGLTAEESISFITSKREICVTAGIEALLSSKWLR
jgi:hypothetical protein